VKLVSILDVTEKVDTWHPAKQTPEGEFSYVDLSSVDQSQKKISGYNRVIGSNAPSRARQLIRAEDILVSTVRPNLNGVAKVPVELHDATASTGFCVLRAKPEMLDADYLFNWVKSGSFVREMIKHSTGANYPAVADRTVRNSEIPIPFKNGKPDLSEQKRIAAILDKADGIRRKRREALQLADDFLRSCFLDMFGNSALKPKATKFVKMKEVGEIQLGRQRAPKYQTGKWTYPYMRVANVRENRIDTSDVLSMDFSPSDFSRYLLQPGDILLNEGQSTELVGRPAIWRNEIANCCFQNTLVRFRVYKGIATPEYALFVFLHYLWFGKFASVSSKTSSIAHLGSARFSEMPFPLVDYNQQVFFSRLCESTMEIKQRLTIQAESTSDLFASLQQRAFKGEL
jgi:type I restriction enzyme S subunit